VAALATTDIVTGLRELIELRLPLVTFPDSHETSKAPEVETGVVVLVDRVMLRADEVWPAAALRFRNVGLATIVPPPGAYVTVTPTGVPLPVPTGVNMTLAVHGLTPQLVLKIWNDKVSGVVKLLELNELSQDGTPET
jgi:hypothetical protein